MSTAQILEFPYARVRLETQSHHAVILKMPERKECPIAMLPAVMALEWMVLWMGGK